MGEVAADDEGKLAFVGHVDVGRLNQVVEVWAYESLESSLAARAASRKAVEWRSAISGIAELAVTFDTQLLTVVGPGRWA